MELSYNTTTIGLHLPMIHSSAFSNYTKVGRDSHSIPKEAVKFKKELDLKKLQPEGEETADTKRIKKGAKHQGLQQMQMA